MNYSRNDELRQVVNHKLSRIIKNNFLYEILENKYLGAVRRVETDETVAALTFDDGPDPQWTPFVLDILKRYNARATFFIVGAQALKYPNILECIHDDGHAVGNHSWNHPSFALIKGKERRRQIRTCEKIIKQHKLHLFRPPFGHLTVIGKLELLFMGYSIIKWNINPKDWLNIKSEVILEYMNAGLKPGSIILLHDTIYRQDTSRDQMLSALESFLRDKQDKYRFVTVPELFRYGKILRYK